MLTYKQELLKETEEKINVKKNQIEYFSTDKKLREFLGEDRADNAVSSIKRKLQRLYILKRSIENNM